ncbi:MAG: hypothetical protein K6F73_01650 [Lachnospiraceae bacterium]|nr:hypothetical protein [Lachnospiraceae bacterium]
MKLKKLIKNIITVLLKIILIVFLAVTLTRIMMPKYLDEESKDGRITQEYYPASSVSDVLFVGSSVVFSGIDPKVLWERDGISAFVRANASQTMWISYYMTEDAIKCHKPELVCLDMTFIKYDDDFVEEPSTRKSVDGMRLSSSKIECALASMGEDERLVEYLIPILRFHSRWKEFTWDDIRYAWYLSPVTMNGYIADYEVGPAETEDLTYAGSPDQKISPKNEEYLRKTIELCADNGVQLLLFKTPSLSSNWSDALDVQISAIADEYGITYINFDRYGRDIGLNFKEDTPDMGSHLNHTGAEKFSEYLGDYINANYEVSDRRDAKKYDRYWSKK